MKRALFVLALAVASCTPSRAPSNAPDAPRADLATIELVESAPVETTLDHADVRDAWQVWPEMIRGAKRTIDLAEFYASDAPGSRLGPVVEELERAIARGVRVRFLADALFAPKYPDTLARLERAGAQVAKLDAGKSMGGVLHAKYFVVDGEELFLGSQNFDHRALEHIQEMGVRVRSKGAARELEDVFEYDWALASGGKPPPRDDAPLWQTRPTQSGEWITLLASPKDYLPAGAWWDLDAIDTMLSRAQRSVDVQLLTYKPAFRDKSEFRRLHDRLRAIAARGVRVRLLVSDWSTHPDEIAALTELASVGVEVRVSSIPKWSGGDVPFARVAHAKFAIADGEQAWIGTSNWEGDYFHRSRNVALLVRGGRAPRRLAQIFEDGWSSAYAKPLDRAQSK